MVGQRAKHLSHAEAAAAVPAEAGFSIGHCDFQGHAGVLDARIVAMRMQAREHADAVVADDDFERARPRRERDKTCARRLAVSEDIVLELAEGADNLGRDASREAGGEGGLICPARPKLPQIRSLAIRPEPLKRETPACAFFSVPVTVSRSSAAAIVAANGASSTTEAKASGYRWCPRTSSARGPICPDRCTRTGPKPGKPPVSAAKSSSSAASKSPITSPPTSLR